MLITQAYNGIPENLRPYIQARSYGHLTTNKNELQEFALKLITFAHNFNGQKDAADSEILYSQTKMFISEVISDFKNLTQEEIKEAFIRGLKGDYGAYMGLNPKTYHFFLKSYIELPERKQAIKLFLELTAPPKVEINEQQKELILKNAALKYFAEYKQDKIFKRHWHSVHDTVNKYCGTKVTLEGKERQTLITDINIRKMINEQSKQEYLAFLKKEEDEAMQSAKFVKAKQIRDMVQFLNTNISYKLTQKKNALKWYFDKLIKEGNELEL